MDFNHELTIMAKLQNIRNVISFTVVVVKYDDEGPFSGFLMLLIDGLRLDQVKHASTQKKKEWILAMRTLHALRVVKEDLKPENVVLDSAGNPYMVDFGGGNTLGWIDKTLAETLQGEKQGMSVHVCLTRVQKINTF